MRSLHIQLFKYLETCGVTKKRSLMYGDPDFSGLAQSSRKLEKLLKKAPSFSVSGQSRCMLSPSNLHLSSCSMRKNEECNVIAESGGWVWDMAEGVRRKNGKQKRIVFLLSSLFASTVLSLYIYILLNLIHPSLKVLSSFKNFEIYRKKSRKTKWKKKKQLRTILCLFF